jgi:hypothetical protein
LLAPLLSHGSKKQSAERFPVLPEEADCDKVLPGHSVVRVAPPAKSWPDQTTQRQHRIEPSSASPRLPSTSVSCRSLSSASVQRSSSSFRLPCHPGSVRLECLDNAFVTLPQCGDNQTHRVFSCGNLGNVEIALESIQSLPDLSVKRLSGVGRFEVEILLPYKLMPKFRERQQ